MSLHASRCWSQSTSRSLWLRCEACVGPTSAEGSYPYLIAGATLPLRRRKRAHRNWHACALKTKTKQKQQNKLDGNFSYSAGQFKLHPVELQLWPQRVESSPASLAVVLCRFVRTVPGIFAACLWPVSNIDFAGGLGGAPPRERAKTHR